MAGPTPTNLVLDLSADYERDGDTVLVAVFIVDPTLEMGFPGFVRQGTCSLLYNGTEISSIEFDKRFGNGPGSIGDFVFQFSHPVATHGLTVSVDASIHNYLVPTDPPLTLTKTIPVRHNGSPFIPLGTQTVTTSDVNEELRSKKRLEEEL